MLAIERVVHVAPWERGQFEEDLRREGATLLGMFESGTLLGYIGYWATPDEVEILNVATAPTAQRRGVGVQLVGHALAAAREQGKQCVRLEVRRGNAPALGLYQKLGFRAIAVRPNYYRDLEDAIVMVLELRAPAA